MNNEVNMTNEAILIKTVLFETCRFFMGIPPEKWLATLNEDSPIPEKPEGNASGARTVIQGQ